MCAAHAILSTTAAATTTTTTTTTNKQDPNTKRFKRTLLYFNTDTHYANFRGNPLYQATIRLKQQING